MCFKSKIVTVLIAAYESKQKLQNKQNYIVSSIIVLKNPRIEARELNTFRMHRSSYVIPLYAAACNLSPPTYVIYATLAEYRSVVFA